MSDRNNKNGLNSNHNTLDESFEIDRLDRAVRAEMQSLRTPGLRPQSNEWSLIQERITEKNKVAFLKPMSLVAAVLVSVFIGVGIMKNSYQISQEDEYAAISALDESFDYFEDSSADFSEEDDFFVF